MLYPLQVFNSFVIYVCAEGEGKRKEMRKSRRRKKIVNLMGHLLSKRPSNSLQPVLEIVHRLAHIRRGETVKKKPESST